MLLKYFRTSTSQTTCSGSKTTSSGTESPAVIVSAPVHPTVRRRQRLNLLAEFRVNLAMVISALAVMYFLSYLAGAASKADTDEVYADSHENTSSH